MAGDLRATVRMLVAVACAGTAFAQEQRHRYVAAPQVTFQHAAAPPMRMPTDVALGLDGSVFIADGVNDRIIKLDPTGALLGEIRRLGDLELSRPIGIDVDRDGRLWIADTGNGRIVARSPDGALVHEIRPAGAARGRAADVTDVAVSVDGTRVWFADNDSHQIGACDLSTGIVSRLGERGESLGQLFYPFLMASAPGGDVLVTDVLNGRAQTFSASGRPAGAIGTYGVELGNLYRPTGLAVDADGNIWVSDGTLGVIQVFRPTRELIDVVRDQDGAPLKLQSPMGIALDAAGSLYVAELAADRVRKFSVAVDRPAPRVAPPARAPATMQPRTCTACHLEWMEPLVRGMATALLEPPLNPRDWPSASRAERCLSCHDGSVVDSRRRVWVDHGHREGVAPPPGMSVPGRLPLADGKIVCRTCHSAHTRGGAGAGIAEAVFLRVQETPDELCLSCHADKTAGPGAGMHPLARLDRPIPEALRAAGAHVPPGSQQVTCLACHRGHGATNNQLLVTDGSGADLCISCHEQMRPAMFQPQDKPPPHPLRARLSGAQLQVAERLGTRFGLGDDLGCLTCHRMHAAPNPRFLLAFDLNDSAACLGCHEEQRPLLGSSHDLRTSFPQEKNRFGVTPGDAGPCSSCHMVHHHAQPAEPTPLDPSGQCSTCHQPGRVAAARSLGPLNHPQSACGDCHDPHKTTHGNYLVSSGLDLCRDCHQAYVAFAGGPHDLNAARESNRHESTWPQAALAAGGACLACHKPHGNAQDGLFRAGLAPGATGADAACLACHAEAAWLMDSPLAAVHPRTGASLGGSHGLPLAPLDGHEQVGCRTCHDAHSGLSVAGHLLRAPAGQSGENLCVTCHTGAGHIDSTGHSQAALAAAGVAADACAPCHVTHAQPQQVEARLLWPRDLAFQQTPRPPGSTADNHCVPCHRPDGPAPTPQVATHPPMAMIVVSAAADSGALPLFDEAGNTTVNGQITCRTCHLSHGRALEGAATHENELSFFMRRARRSQLRPFDPPNLCTGCHGFDGLRRFLYFHDPQRRTAQSAEVQPPSIWRPR